MVAESLPVNWEKGVKLFGEEELMSALNDFEPLSFDFSTNYYLNNRNEGAGNGISEWKLAWGKAKSG